LGGDVLVLANKYTDDQDVVKGGGGFERIILTAHPCYSLRPMARPAIAGTLSVTEALRRNDSR